MTTEIERRQKGSDAEFPPIYVFIYGLHRLRDLRRQEDDFGFSRAGEQRPADPAKQLFDLKKLAHMQLMDGVAGLEIGECCLDTKTNTLFHSYRRGRASRERHRNVAGVK